MNIRRLRLEYLILLERLEERAISIPDEVKDSEDMSPPPSPSLLDDSINASNSEVTKNKLAKKGKKPRRFLSSTAPSKVQKIRDPDLPKRPTNAYLIFCDLEKDRIKLEIEAKNGLVSDLSKTMTEAWKNLDQNRRGPYYKLYEEDRERYKKEMEVYNRKKQTDDDDDDDDKRTKNQKLDLESETPEVSIKSEPFDSQEDGVASVQDDVEMETEDGASVR